MNHLIGPEMSPSRCLLVAVALLCITGCDSNPSEPRSRYNLLDDVCYNDDPISQYDSTWQEWPNMKCMYKVWGLTISKTTGLWAGNVFVNGCDSIPLFTSGCFIYDPVGNRLLDFVGGSNPQWSPDGRSVLTDLAGGFQIYDPLAHRVVSNVAIGGASSPHWSVDSGFITFTGNTGSNTGLIRVRPDGTSMQVIMAQGLDARELDSRRCIGFDVQGLYLYTIADSTKTYLNLPGLTSGRFVLHFPDPATWDISPDKKRILIDLSSKDGFIVGRESAGLFLIDLEKQTLSKIREQQYWGDLFYPTWLTNDTFMGSYFCRTRSVKKSATMVWEFDLLGGFVREVTYTWMPLFR